MGGFYSLDAQMPTVYIHLSIHHLYSKDGEGYFIVFVLVIFFLSFSDRDFKF